ncbi:hypothetical protein V8C26DRAFT_385347 [Trichoderma gracile]
MVAVLFCGIFVCLCSRWFARLCCRVTSEYFLSGLRRAVSFRGQTAAGVDEQTDVRYSTCTEKGRMREHPKNTAQ